MMESEEKEESGTDAGHLGEMEGEHGGWEFLHVGEVGGGEGALEVCHLDVGEGGEGMVGGADAVAGLRLVGEEAVDEGEVDDESTFLLGGMDEEDCGDDHRLYIFALAAFPIVQFCPRCHV